MTIPGTSPQVYTDLQGLTQLKGEARNNSPEALQAAAKQFEAIFIHMMLKSMREANLGEGLFDSQQSNLYQDMFDQQIALSLSQRQQFGLADALIRQFGGQPINPQDQTSNSIAPAMDKTDETKLGEKSENFSPRDFIERLAPMVKKAAEQLGIPAGVIIAQAALETGWGQSLPGGPNGSSNNLFGIKATSNWEGRTSISQTYEFVEGTMQKKSAAFRAYDSWQESVDDYVKLISTSPRYQEALKTEGDGYKYLQILQKSGYATDPIYTEKVNNIMKSDVFLSAIETVNIL